MPVTLDRYKKGDMNKRASQSFMMAFPQILLMRRSSPGTYPFERLT
jgi:hypothetical protein